MATNQRVLKVRFFDGREKQAIQPIRYRDEFPPKIFELSERMMDWYHALGKHLEIGPEDLIRQFPHFLIRVEGFTILVEGGGEKYPDSVCLGFFSPKEMVVDELNFMYPEPGKELPQKWPHGAIVVDGSKPLDFEPEVVRPHLWFSQGSFRIVVYDRLSERVKGAEDLFGFSLLVVNEHGLTVFARRYIYSGWEYDKFPQILDDGVPVVDARKPFDYVSADPLHPKFIPPQ